MTAQLTGIGRLGVAFSGGVDSATLLALAVRALGPDRVVALLGVSPSLAADERTAAHDVARHIGVPVVEVVTREGERADYRANGPDRCFHCKDELFTPIADEVLERHGLDRIAYGENADDVRRPDRPGARAATAARACCGPLADAGLDKAAVRRVAAGARPAVRRQAGRALPGLADPAPRAGDAGEAGPGRGGGAGAARARLHRLPGAPPRRRRPGRAARRRDRPAAAATLREQVHRRGRRRRVPVRGRRPRRDPVGGVHPAARGGSAWLTSRTAEEMLAGFAELDLDRARRRGYPEAVYCRGQDTGAGRADRRGAARAAAPGPCSPGPTAAHAAAVLAELPDALHAADCGLLAWPPEPPEPVGGRVLVVAAGTADHAVAREALLTARHLGRTADLVMDVGVAGLHRILAPARRCCAPRG